MKTKLRIVFLTAFIISAAGCSRNNSEPASGDSENTRDQSKPYSIACSSFFGQGDYSSICFLDARPYDTLIATFGGSNPNDVKKCVYYLIDRASGKAAAVELIENPNVSLTKYFMNDARTNAEGNYRVELGLGDEAMQGTERSSDPLIARKGNIIVTLAPSDFGAPPCLTSYDEIRQLMRIILSNID